MGDLEFFSRFELRYTCDINEKKHGTKLVLIKKLCLPFHQYHVYFKIAQITVPVVLNDIETNNVTSLSILPRSNMKHLRRCLD